MSTLEELLNWEKEIVESVANHLNEKGIVSDEDGYGLPSTWIEGWTNGHTDYLKKHGYKGGVLSHVGKYVSNYGAVYALYDEEQSTYEEAMNYIEKFAKSDV